MALEIEKKKNASSEVAAQRSKGLNIFLWLLSVVAIAIAALGNIYFTEQFSTPIRVVGIVVLLVLALVFMALTNQGKRFLIFFNDAKTELKRITWPTRPEATQTTLIVVAVTLVVSLILWGIDSIIVTIINFLTAWRF